MGIPVLTEARLHVTTTPPSRVARRLPPQRILRRVRRAWTARGRLPSFVIARLMVRLATRAEARDDLESAEAAYRLAIARDASVPSWRNRHERVLKRLRRSGNARSGPDVPLRGDVGSVESWMRVGREHERAKDWRAAMEAYQRAVALDPGLAEGFERLGLACDHLLRYREARRAFSRALELDPGTQPIDRTLLAVKPNFFTYRRDQARFVGEHLEEIRELARVYQAESAATETPKIFVYWGQGFDHAPPIVARCRTELDRWHDERDVVELDDTTVPDWVDIPPYVERIRERHRAHYSDYLRCALLRRYGGVWADATLLTTGSILDRLPELLPSGFFVFRFSPESPSISNWFVAARAGGEMITTLAAALDVYWQHHSRPVHYFFFHHVFEALFHLDDEFRAGWERTWRHPGHDPRALLACMYEPWDPARAATALENSFVHKLAHKGKGDRFPPDRMLELLAEHPATPWA